MVFFASLLGEKGMKGRRYRPPSLKLQVAAAMQAAGAISQWEARANQC
jgi:hypothetical protein